jgi:IS5 family transposase
VVEADLDHPTDADLLEAAVRKLGGLVRRSRPEGRPAGPGSAIEDARLGGGCRQLARTLRRRGGVAMAEVDRLTAQVAAIARHTLRQVQVVARNAGGGLARRPGDGGWIGWSANSRRRLPRPAAAGPDQPAAGR